MILKLIGWVTCICRNTAFMPHWGKNKKKENQGNQWVRMPPLARPVWKYISSHYSSNLLENLFLIFSCPLFKILLKIEAWKCISNYFPIYNKTGNILVLQKSWGNYFKISTNFIWWQQIIWQSVWEMNIERWKFSPR